MSTALSISIINFERAGRLKRFMPRFHGQEEEARKLTLVPNLYEWVHDDGQAGVLASMKASTRAQFGEFVKGELVDDCVFMKRVEDFRPAAILSATGSGRSEAGELSLSIVSSGYSP